MARQKSINQQKAELAKLQKSLNFQTKKLFDAKRKTINALYDFGLSQNKRKTKNLDFDEKQKIYRKNVRATNEALKQIDKITGSNLTPEAVDLKKRTKDFKGKKVNLQENINLAKKLLSETKQALIPIINPVRRERLARASLKKSNEEVEDFINQVLYDEEYLGKRPNATFDAIEEISDNIKGVLYK